MTTVAGQGPAAPAIANGRFGRGVGVLSRWWHSTPALLVPAVATAALCVLLSHILPLSHDEATNWLHYSRFGPHFIITTYDRPNNHVLFTLVQAALPDSWVQTHPLLVRVPNVVYATVLVTLMARWLLRIGVPVWLATLGLLAGGPLTVVYLGIARGYLLGTLLLFAGLELLAASRGRLGRTLLAGLLTALSLWTLPTFAFGLPGVGLVLLLRRRWRDLLVWGITAVGVAVLLYLPILRTMLSQRDSHGAAMSFGAYTGGVLQHATWITAWAPGRLSDLMWIVGLVVAVAALGLAAWRRRAHSQPTDPVSVSDAEAGPAEGAAQRIREVFLLLAAYSVSDLVVIEAGNATGAMHAPYFRNSLFVSYVAVILVLAATARSGWPRWVAGLVTAANIVAAGVGIGLLVHADDYSIGLYDNVLMAAPPPALRNLHAPAETSIHCDRRDLGICHTYRWYLQQRGVKVAFQKAIPDRLPCVVGSVAPMPGHSVMVFRGVRLLGRICEN